MGSISSCDCLAPGVQQAQENELNKEIQSDLEKKVLVDREFVEAYDANRSNSSKPLGNSPFFKGNYSQKDADRLGFFSIYHPPDIGEEVVCFHRDHWLERGKVDDVSEQVSDGQDGLRKGVEGARVTVCCQDGHTFLTWASFLASADDREYSSLCTPKEFQASNYFHLVHKDGGDLISNTKAQPRTSRLEAQPAVRVTKTEARASLEAWLEHLVDADGEEMEVSDEMKKELLGIFDEKQDASLHLYSLHKRLGPRTSSVKGKDYSLYYQALNNTLNHDTEAGLSKALHLIRRMVYLLLYDESTGEPRLHEGGRVWKGDSEQPVPLNRLKLQEALRNKSLIHFRQFQSTTSDEKVASRFRKREDHPGFTWMIDIPSEFFGARNIQDISSRSKESETLFPPFSAFEVLDLDDKRCHLRAVEMDPSMYTST
eukprot:TRINITY_DN19794_c0_g1_i2.p1 TRINITY_DN19794_c0_g1~~TRINITY_DN19794_c0_g1_i2.p1  ORF type:complete len:428 (+),score=86.98 TRINITY_DN19794_c0_g1_i2:61-1344(+)